MKIRCYLFGHTRTDYNDSGFHVCERCNSHEYYDCPYHWTRSAVLLKPVWFVKRVFYKAWYFVAGLFDKSHLPF